MAGPGRPERRSYIDRAMEIQAWADELRREAKAELAEELRLQRAAGIAEMTEALADAHITLDLASALKFVGWRMAGRASRREVVA